MKPKIMIKNGIDLLMTLGLLGQMAYMLTGQLVHEWMGTAMFLMFITHNVLNVAWYKRLLKGRYTPFRVLQTSANLLLVACMLGLMVSGIMMSSHVFAFLPIESGMAFARILHMLAAYWGFVLMSFHLGLHWGMIMGMAKKATGLAKTPTAIVVGQRLLAVLIAGYGVYAFVKHDIVSYMFVRSQFVFFDYSQSAQSFFLEYLCIMGLFVFIAYYVAKLMQNRPRLQSKARKEPA